MTEDEIKALFLRALDRLLSESETLLEDCRFMREALTDCRELDAEIDALNEEMEDAAIRMERLIAENASGVMDQEDYEQKHDRLEERFEAARTRQEELLKTKKTRSAEAREIGRFADTLRAGRSAGFTWSDDLWLTLIDHATVTADEHMVFTFKNGTELAERL